MGSGDGTDEPDWRHNVLRDRLGSAATTASGALDALAASTGNPLTSLVSAIDGEPVRIDVNAHPQLKWKTSEDGVDGRVYTANQRPW